MVYKQIPHCDNKKDRIHLLKIIVKQLKYYLYHDEMGYQAKDMYYNCTRDLIEGWKAT